MSFPSIFRVHLNSIHPCLSRSSVLPLSFILRHRILSVCFLCVLHSPSVSSILISSEQYLAKSANREDAHDAVSLNLPLCPTPQAHTFPSALFSQTAPKYFSCICYPQFVRANLSHCNTQKSLPYII